MRINLERALDVLEEADQLFDQLNGAPLDERRDGGSAADRRVRAKRSRGLLLLAHHLELAARLVHDEYWRCRTGKTPLRKPKGAA